MSDELDTELSKGIYVNVGGSWFKAFSEWNEATGGDKIGTFEVTSELLAKDPKLGRVGAIWKYHWFTTDGTFAVEKGKKPFRYVLVSGGYGGGSSGVSSSGPGGPGGRVLASDSGLFEKASYSISLGTGGVADTGNNHRNNPGTDSTVVGGAVSLTTSGQSHGATDVYFTGEVGPWGVSGKGGNGGGCAGSFGQNAGCGSVGQQEYGGGRAGCGCKPGDCYQCGGGCSGCASGHGPINGKGGGGGGGGACCNGGAGRGAGGGFIIAYEVAKMEPTFTSEAFLNDFEVPHDVDADLSTDFDDEIEDIFNAG